MRVGLNPYGLAYAIGLTGAGTPRANPAPMPMPAFIDLALELGARVVELDGRWLLPLPEADLRRVGDRLRDAGATAIVSDWLTQTPGETLERPIAWAAALGAPVLRLHLTPVLAGGRAALGRRWPELVRHGRQVLDAGALAAGRAGITLAVENHQDFTSEELIQIADSTPNTGIVMDTGNPFAVGEDPVAFARRAGDRIRHVHLKDYVAQFTAEGYRLIRCVVGEGCVPFAELQRLLPADVTASIEPGAREARHVRLLTPGWWTGYPPREASELATALGRLQHRALEGHRDGRTPWESGASADEITTFEVAQVRASLTALRARLSA